MPATLARPWLPRLVILAVCALPLTACERKDDRCRAIGETSSTALRARDRSFFEEACVCDTELGCAARGSARGRQVEEQRSRREAERALREAELAAVAANRAACRVLGACLDEKGPAGCEPDRVAYLSACIGPTCAETYASLYMPGFVSRERLCEYSAAELKAARTACEKYVTCMANEAIPMCAKPGNCEAPRG